MERRAGIEIRGLGKSFGHREVLRGVDLEVHHGQVTGLLGPNGSGKTTVLKCLTGLCRPTRGEALVEGRPYADHPRPSSVIGVALDAQTVDPAMSGWDHLRVCAARGGHPRTRVEECVEELEMGLYAHRRTRTWSTGMRQRLALAAALLGRPGVLVLDEPTNGLDPQGIAWTKRFVRTLADDGRAVLVSTHVLAEFEPVLDAVAVIRDGRTLAQGAPEQLAGATGARGLEGAYEVLMGVAA